MSYNICFEEANHCIKRKLDAYIFGFSEFLFSSDDSMWEIAHFFYLICSACFMATSTILWNSLELTISYFRTDNGPSIYFSENFPFIDEHLYIVIKYFTSEDEQMIQRQTPIYPG